MIYSIGDRVLVTPPLSPAWFGEIVSFEAERRPAAVVRSELGEQHEVYLPYLLPGHGIPRVEQCRACGMYCFTGEDEDGELRVVEAVPDSRGDRVLVAVVDVHGNLGVPKLRYNLHPDLTTPYRLHQHAGGAPGWFSRRPGAR